MELNLESLPPVCLNWATDVLEQGPAAGPIEGTMAIDGLRAATRQQFGVGETAECRVRHCPVKCKLINQTALDGSVQLAGVVSEEGITDLNNCSRP